MISECISQHLNALRATSRPNKFCFYRKRERIYKTKTLNHKLKNEKETKMKKIMMIVVLLLSTTMNIWAVPEEPTEPTLTIAVADDAIYDNGVTVLGDLVYNGEDLDLGHYHDFILASNEFFVINKASGAVSLKQYFAALAEGDEISVVGKLQERDDEGAKVGSIITLDPITVTVSAGVGEPVVRPVFDDITFAVDPLDSPLATLSATGGDDIEYREIRDTTKEYDGINNSDNFTLHGTLGEINTQNALMAGGTVYHYKVRATNADSGSTTVIIELTVEESAPVWQVTTVTAYDDKVATDTLGPVTATSGSTVTYSEKDGGLGESTFNIDPTSGAVILEAATISANIYSYEVIATANETDTPATITITISEAPVLPNIVTTTLNIPELSENGFTFDPIVITGGYGDLTLSEDDSEDPSVVFFLNEGGLIELADSSALNFEAEEEETGSKTFTFRFKVTDQSDNPEPAVDIQAITISVTNENEITLEDEPTRTVAVNVPDEFAVGDPIEIEEEGEPNVDWEVTPTNPGGAPFEIATNGQLSVDGTSVLSIGAYTFNVTATDKTSGDSKTEEVTVTVVAATELLNAVPDYYIDENTPANQTIGEQNLSPLIFQPVNSYSIESNPFLDINPTTGKFITKVLLDHESVDNVFYLDVTVTTDTDSDTETLTIKVGNLNDTGNVTITTENFDIDENLATPAYVGLVTVDATFPFQIEFSSEDENFDITTEGAITIAEGTVLDFEIQDTYIMTVTATDPISLDADQKDITININDLLEDGSPELSDQGFILYSDTYVDADLTGIFLSVTGDIDQFTNTSTDFNIGTTTGEIIVLNSAALVDGALFEFTVTATNTETSEFDTATITILVVDQEEPLGDAKKKKSGNTFRKLKKASTCLVADLNPALMGLLMGLLVIVLLIPFSKALKA
ncbi:MAG: cadherin repeat domain-containing protein [Nitrosomonadaceae bacterium]